MRVVVLIAGNFVREQRWVVAAWVAMALGFAGVIAGVGEKPTPDDVQFYFSQQALYGVGLGVFLAAVAIHNERKSRRILAVLSKAVSRSQYVAGLLLGVWLCSAAHCLSLALARTWLAARMELPAGEAWFAAGLVLVAAMLAASVAMFWSSFAGPLGAVVGAGALLGAPALATQYLDGGWMQALPVYWLTSFAMNLPAQWEAPWGTLALAAVEAAAFWALAAWVFARRDVTAAIE